MFFRLQGFICVDIKYPRERILSKHGAFVLQNFDFYIGLFTQKPSVFRADFPIFPVGAAICRPPKTQSVFPLYTALCAVTIAALPRAKS